MNPPFSPVREVDGWVYLAGQGGFGADGELAGETIEAQTEQTLRNVVEITVIARRPGTSRDS